MEYVEKVVIFSSEGKRLHGILHYPLEVRKPHGGMINILCPGTKHRVGPHRLNVKLARHYAKLGYYCFRFDPSGIGDSEGHIAEGHISSIWSRLQLGLFVKNTVASNRLINEMIPNESITLLGLCGGAATAVHTASIDNLVDRVVAIDLPSRLSSFTDISYEETITSKTYADQLFGMYIKKISNPAAWKKLLTLKTDYKALMKVIRLKLFASSPGKDKILSQNFNIELFRAYKRYEDRGGKTLFIAAEKEHTTGEFEEEYLPLLRQDAPKKDLWKYTVIKNSNHVYTLPEWENELRAEIDGWLQNQ